MPHITHYLPELQEETEATIVQQLLDHMSHDQAVVFAGAYRQQRKDPQNVLLMAIIGLVAIPGLQRFWLGQTGMGLLYLFTWGFQFVGSIYDLVKYKTLALRYNHRVANRIATNLAYPSGQSRSDEGTPLLPHAGFAS